MKNNKRLYILLAILVFLAIATVTVLMVLDYTSKHGSCGKNLSWSYDGDGTLTISGTGKMDDYDDLYSYPEWMNYLDEIDTVIFEDGVQSIGSYAFNNYTNKAAISEIIIADSVKSIGRRAFYGCEKLEEINLPDSITRIEHSAFGDCTSLERVTLPSKLEYIGSAFSGCTSLRNIVLPESVTTLDGTFNGCTKLEKIIIPESVTTMTSTFVGCTSLTSVTLPQNLETLDDDLFSGCFTGCTSLTEITLPQGLKTIERHAFRGCTALKSIVIPSSVTSIKESAFEGCTSLSEIYFQCHFPFDDNRDMSDNESKYVFRDVTATAYIDSSVASSWYGKSVSHLLGEIDWRI